jgi:putative endonuclease
MSESSVTAKHLRLGAQAEELAVDMLERRGFRLIERNWRCIAGELDAVMWDGKELVFVEVKARTGGARGSAEEALTAAKAGKLATAAEWYLADHPEVGDPIWRIDLVALTYDRSGAVSRMVHIANAAEFG